MTSLFARPEILTVSALVVILFVHPAVIVAIIIGLVSWWFLPIEVCVCVCVCMGVSSSPPESTRWLSA